MERGDWDVVVVGAGLGGLLCAAELAGWGHRVAVLESAAQVGGRGGSELREGQWVDRGGHAVFAHGHLHRALRRHGLEEATVPVPTTGVQVRVGGVAHALSVGGLWSARWLSSRDRRALAGFLSRLVVGSGDTLHDRLLAPMPLGPGRDLAEAMVRISTYCGRPDLLGSAALPHLRRALGTGVRYVHGGWQSLAEALVGVIEEAGGRVERNARVREVSPRAVSTRDATFRARQVVLAVPRGALRRLGGASAPLARTEGAVGALSVVLPRSVVPSQPRAVISLDHPTFLVNFGAVVSLGAPDGTVVQVTHYRPGEGAEAEALAAVDDWCPGWRAHGTHRWMPRISAHTALPGVGWRPLPMTLEGGLLWVAADTGDGLLADAVASSARTAAGRAHQALVRSAA